MITMMTISEVKHSMWEVRAELHLSKISSSEQAAADDFGGDMIGGDEPEDDGKPYSLQQRQVINYALEWLLHLSRCR